MNRKLIDIICGTRAYNLHTHTQFCDGHNTISQMCASALGAGVQHLGFTPHSPVHVASPCNMALANLPAYHTNILQARHEFPSLNILMGMEIDFFDSPHHRQNLRAIDIPLDYVISSVHFIPDKNGDFVDIDGSAERFSQTLRTRFDSNLEHVVDNFFDASEAMVRQGGFDIIGHFDKIAMNATTINQQLELTPHYRQRMQHLIGLIARAGIIVEINTKHFEKSGRFFPDKAVWRQLRDLNIPLAINSDAHWSDKITASRNEAFKIIDAL